MPHESHNAEDLNELDAENEDSKGRAVLDNAPKETDSENSLLGFLSKPFNIYGKTFTIKDPEKMRDLMRSGIIAGQDNKAPKTISITPAMSAVERSGLSAETIQQLIDIGKGDITALQHYISKHNIDYEKLAIEENKDVDYRPKTRLPSPQELQIEQRAAFIRSKPALSKRVSEALDFFGDAHAQSIWENPALLDNLVSHIQTGLFDDVLSQIDKEEAAGAIFNSSENYKNYVRVANNLINSRMNHRFQPPKVDPAHSSGSSLGKSNNTPSDEAILGDIYSDDPAKAGEALKLLEKKLFKQRQ